MALIKCPRCELNYILESEGYCKICRREMKGEGRQDEIDLCTVCNEAPALPGKDVCLFCLKEMNSANEDREESEEDVRSGEATLDIDPVSGMDEIIPEINEEVSDKEYSEIERDLSLEEMGEEEADEDDEEEDEDK